jgi:hypothetical protein
VRRGIHWLLRSLFLIAVALCLYQGRLVREHVIGAKGFVYAGSDSYGYVGLAHELLEHHRYALGPPPQPLHWARPPGFPLYLTVVMGRAEAKMTGGEGWGKIARGNAALEIYGTGPLLCFAVGWIAGLVPGLLALLLMMIGPWNALVTPAALTETFATFLVTATIAMLIPPAMGSPRRGWLIAAGALFALGVLTRPDTMLIAPAFAFAILGAARALAPRDRRASLRALGAPTLAAIASFAVVFAPWPLRNLARFGAAHPLGGRIDRWSQPVENYQGSWAFLRAISRDWRPMTRLTTCYYDLSCRPTVGDFWQANAELTESERDQITSLLALRATEGHSVAVSKGFQALADARRRAHPFDVEVRLPWKRLTAMWIADHDELTPYYAPGYPWVKRMRRWSRELVWTAFAGALLLLVDRRRRLAGLVLIAATLGRTALMAWAFYSMPRYSLESVPSAFALIAAGLGAASGRVATALRRAWASTKSTSGVESASTKT